MKRRCLVVNYGRILTQNKRLKQIKQECVRTCSSPNHEKYMCAAEMCGSWEQKHRQQPPRTRARREEGVFNIECNQTSLSSLQCIELRRARVVRNS
jgi:hypothetical protein